MIYCRKGVFSSLYNTVKGDKYIKICRGGCNVTGFLSDYVYILYGIITLN